MNLSQLTITPVFPLWLIVLLFLLGLAGVILQYPLIRKRLGDRRTLVISLLRLVAVFSLVSFALSFPGGEERRSGVNAPGGSR